MPTQTSPELGGRTARLFESLAVGTWPWSCRWAQKMETKRSNEGSHFEKNVDDSLLNWVPPSLWVYFIFQFCIYTFLFYTIWYEKGWN